MKGNLLVTLADRNFVDQAKQLFSSAYWNAGWDGEYMLLACDVPEPQLRWFREKGILVREVKPFSKEVETFSGAGSWDEKLRYPPTVTCKLGLFSPDFKIWNHVVFVDADCIVRYPLNSLTKLKAFAAARDWLDTAIIKYQVRQPERTNESAHFQRLNEYSLTATAFNTGVFAFNTEIISDTGYAALQRTMREYRDLARFPEQLCMNLYFYKKWQRLPMEYNLFASYLHTKRGLPKERVDGVVLHFPRFGDEQGLRCWDRGNAFYDEWKKNLERAEQIDLERIPEARAEWPGLRRFSFQAWRVRLALRSHYVNFFRSKMSVRTRIRRIAGLSTRSVIVRNS